MFYPTRAQSDDAYFRAGLASPMPTGTLVPSEIFGVPSRILQYSYGVLNVHFSTV
jgi:hypothetical protein